MAHRSTPGFLASARSFFYVWLVLAGPLELLGARLAQAKAQLANQPLALTRLQLHLEFLLQIAGERFAIPNPTPLYAALDRTLAQRSCNLGHLHRTQAGRPPGRGASVSPAKPSFSNDAPSSPQCAAHRPARRPLRPL